MPEARQIETPGGPGRAFTYAASGPDPLATVVLGHGAGGGLGASDLVLLARALPERGYRVILIEQPWKVAGRKIAGRPPTLDAAWVPMIAALGIVGPLVVGGRSAGARVACRTAAEVGAGGVLCLSFPLHPPGKPEASRAGELRAPGGTAYRSGWCRASVIPSVAPTKCGPNSRIPAGWPACPAPTPWAAPRPRSWPPP
ncbi:MAG: alpha/beta family hydrolase [Dermatophilaceae bacterium]